MKEVSVKENKDFLKLKDVTDNRICENKKLFSVEELTFIKSNSILVEKIYLLGLIDGQNKRT